MGPKAINSMVEVNAHRHVMGEDGKRQCTMPEAHRPKNLKPKQRKQPKTTNRKKQKLNGGNFEYRYSYFKNMTGAIY